MRETEKQKVESGKQKSEDGGKKAVGHLTPALCAEGADEFDRGAMSLDGGPEGGPGNRLVTVYLSRP